MYLCFIDHEKAFEKVKHGKLMELLVNKGPDSRDIHVIISLYSQQTAAVNVEGQMKEDIEMG